MKLPLRIENLAARGELYRDRIVDADYKVIIDDRGLSTAELERIVLSVNAMASLTLDQIRAMGRLTPR